MLNQTEANRVITTTLHNQNSEVYDAVIERKGRDKVQSFERENRQVLHAQASSRKELIKSGKIDSAILELKQIKRQQQQEAESYVAAFSREVKAGQKARNEKEVSLSEFKDKNKLTRSATFNENKKFFVFLLCLTILFEGVFNAFSLAKASEYALVGGFVAAVAISVVNLCLAFLFVQGCRYALHIETKRSVGGILSFVLCGTVAFFGALLVGHYRTALEADVPDAGAVAVTTWWADFFAIGSFSSIVLSGITIVICVAFVVEFWGLDDRYPGYGKITRETIAARKRFSELNARAMRKTSEMKQKLQDRFEAAQDKINELSKSLEEDIEALDLLEQDYESYLLLQRSEFETFCEECRQRFSHECTQILDKKADLNKAYPTLEFPELHPLANHSERELFDKKKAIIRDFLENELESLRRDYQDFVNSLAIDKEVTL